jgi:hypothetical protein
MILETDPENLLKYDILFDEEVQESLRLLEEPCSRGDLPPGVQDSPLRYRMEYGRKSTCSRVVEKACTG